MSTHLGLLRSALILCGSVLLSAGESRGVEAASLEFRGVVQEGTALLVNLYQPATKTSHWIPVGGEAGGWQVCGYDDQTGRATVVQDGQIRVLPLKQYRLSLSGPTAPLKLLGPGERIPASEAPGMPDFMRELPPDARRLLEDVRRRRAIRWPAPAAGTAPGTSP